MRDHRSVGSGFDSGGFAAARIAHHIVDLVVAGPGAFGAGHVLALNEYAEGVVLRRKGSIGFQFLTHGDIQLAAGGVVGRDDQGLFGRLDVASGDGADAFFRVGNLLHAALLLERFERGGDLAFGQQLDGGLQRRVFLADDLVELGRAHSGLLQLLERAARFDALMLAGVADQEYAVVGAEARKELAHLVGAGKARFIDKVEVPLVRELPGWASGQGTLAGFLTRRQPRQAGGRRGRSGRSPRPA